MKHTVAALVSALILTAAVSFAQDRKPNIIFIMADDLGYGELGCYGQQKIKTPNIDKLCSQGMKFTDYYAGSTVCAPSRSVLMTGQHMGHTWVRGNAGQDNPHAQSLRPEDVTVAEVLKGAGYSTAITGKWGLGDTVERAMEGLPNRQGFDFFFGYFNQRHAHNYYPAFLYRNEERMSLPNQGNYDPTGAGVATVKKVYAHDLVLEESLNFLESAAGGDKPFFLFLSWTLPHANNEANRAIKNGTEVPNPGMYAEKDWTEQNKGHAAMITYLDTQVGKVLEALKRHGLEENTIVFFTSDNGPHREGGNDPAFFNSDGVVRGIKRDLYDGGIRVPMIVRWPGKVTPGSVTDHVAYHGDIMATLADITGARPPKNIDSISFLPTLVGKGDQQKQHPYLYWEFYEGGGKQAVRMGKWKAVRMPMITGELELYDLSKDLKEQNNLASQRPDLVKQMDAVMKEAHVPNPNWKVPDGPGDPSPSRPQETRSKRKPNVILIMADDLGYADLSCYGNAQYQTPYLDALAAAGMRFTDYHSNGPVCSPTRAALLTGRYQQRAGVPQVIYAALDADNRHHGLHSDAEWTFAEAMKQGGYATALIGKWHLGYDKQYNPVHHGFDRFIGYVSGNVDFHSHIDGAG